MRYSVISNFIKIEYKCFEVYHKIYDYMYTPKMDNTGLCQPLLNYSKIDSILHVYCSMSYKQTHGIYFSDPASERESTGTAAAAVGESRRHSRGVSYQHSESTGTL
jgi:hypothetical protein